jgi:hypothetical protein
MSHNWSTAAALRLDCLSRRPPHPGAASPCRALHMNFRGTDRRSDARGRRRQSGGEGEPLSASVSRQRIWPRFSAAQSVCCGLPCRVRARKRCSSSRRPNFIVVGADWRVGAGAVHCPQPAHSQALADRQPVQSLVSNWMNSYEWCLSKRPIRVVMVEVIRTPFVSKCHTV